jgi:hypothetical protein
MDDSIIRGTLIARKSKVGCRKMNSKLLGLCVYSMHVCFPRADLLEKKNRKTFPKIVVFGKVSQLCCC